MAALKSTIKKLMVAMNEQNYKKVLKSKNMDYNSWIKGLETSKNDENFAKIVEVKYLTIEEDNLLFESEFSQNDSGLAENNKLCKLVTVRIDENDGNSHINVVICKEDFFKSVVKAMTDGRLEADAVVITRFDGKLAKNAIEKISVEFLNDKNKILIYSDEDVEDSVGYRSNPWFKPDWSPDEFTEVFYFGGFVALNASYMKEIKYNDEDDLYSYIYKLLLFNRAFDKHDINFGKVIHIPEVLYHSKVPSYEYVKGESLRNRIVERIENVKVSVIIPSKDHPEILIRCIDSFIDVTDKDSNIEYELIVVDNGSNESNRQILEDILARYGARYIYEEKLFNFAHMCNLGAKNATGNYLLFLNDDMEIIESDWLKKLVSKAHLPYAGAVGAKLLYPNSDTIQHAGITNLRIGPAHKLQFLSDSIDHYFGRNRYVHDMLAVTGACLLVKKSVFDEVNGFDENLAVAFNDVDLCYRIYEKGYYNIERCDVSLFHHESLSRGNDAESEEKQKRLNREKDYLYERHLSLYGKDPFYNVNLTTDMWEYEYAPKYHYEVRLDLDWAKVDDITEVIERAREDKCVRIGMESAMDIYKWKHGISKEKADVLADSSENGFYFQGYTFVIGSNNACFDRQLFLKNTATNRYYGVEVNIEYRPDIAGNVPDQLNVDLAGYTAKMKADILPNGHYQFGMLMKDRTSKLRLYNMSNWTIDI